jgi:hypothetical protein
VFSEGGCVNGGTRSDARTGAANPTLDSRGRASEEGGSGVGSREVRWTRGDDVAIVGIASEAKEVWRRREAALGLWDQKQRQARGGIPRTDWHGKQTRGCCEEGRAVREVCKWDERRARINQSIPRSIN